MDPARKAWKENDGIVRRERNMSDRDREEIKFYDTMNQIHARMNSNGPDGMALARKMMANRKD
jgi:hypothetical protein